MGQEVLLLYYFLQLEAVGQWTGKYIGARQSCLISEACRPVGHRISSLCIFFKAVVWGPLGQAKSEVASRISINCNVI